MKAKIETGGSIGFAGILFIVFLVLKLTKVINWSWWWIFAPLWIPVVLVVLIIVFLLLVLLILYGIKNSRRQKDE